MNGKFWLLLITVLISPVIFAGKPSRSASTTAPVIDNVQYTNTGTLVINGSNLPCTFDFNNQSGISTDTCTSTTASVQYLTPSPAITYSGTYLLQPSGGSLFPVYIDTGTSATNSGECPCKAGWDTFGVNTLTTNPNVSNISCQIASSPYYSELVTWTENGYSYRLDNQYIDGSYPQTSGCDLVNVSTSTDIISPTLNQYLSQYDACMTYLQNAGICN